MAVGNDYPKDVIRDLIEGTLPWEQTRQIMSGYKDAGRFKTYIQVLQEQVRWDDRILLPLGEHLFIVLDGNVGTVKCTCGHTFGDFRSNWKLEANILVRNDEESLREILGRGGPDPEWQEVREFICPGCATLLEVDVAIVGHPVVFDFQPDLVSFYRDWLAEPLPAEFQG